MVSRWSLLILFVYRLIAIESCDIFMQSSRKRIPCWCSFSTFSFLINLFWFPHPMQCSTLQTSSDMLSVSFSIPEETRVGTKVGNIFAKLNQNPHSTLSSGKTQLLEMKPNRYLTLNSSTGDLFVRSRIDRESLCADIGSCCASPTLIRDENHLSSFSLHDVPQSNQQTLFASCVIRMLILQSPTGSNVLEILVYILDINDNAPSWPYMVLELDVPEHVTPGTVYKIPEARDSDQGPTNTVVAYRMFSAEYNRESGKLSCPSCAQMSMNENTYTRSAFTLDSQLIHSSSTSALQFSLQLRVEQELDREKQSTYYYILYAIDGKEDYRIQNNWISSHGDFDRRSLNPVQYTGTLTIRINILDVNDHAPTFVDPKPAIKVAENTKPGTVIYQMSAMDVDTSDQNNLMYKISSSASPEVHRCFQINSQTGEISLKQRLSRHNASLLSSSSFSYKDIHTSGSIQRAESSLGYLIPVLVTDKIHQTEAILQVQLLQVNMHAPIINIASHLKMSPNGAQLWVPENTPTESILAMINVEDPDKPFSSSSGSGEQQFGRPECFTNQEAFTIRPLAPQTETEFKLLLMHALDREQKDVYSIKIECWDGGSPPLSSETILAISVEDVDDSAPVFDRALYLGSVKETASPNTPILKVHATDADSGANAEIVYRIVRQAFTPVSSLSPVITFNDEKAFLSINSKTGDIYSEITFDREVITSVNCTVEAVGAKYLENRSKTIHQGQSLGEHLLFKATTEVVITIEDVNDVRPYFNTSAYEFSIEEGKLPHTKIGQILATDLDAEPPNNIVHYSMKSVSGPIGQLAKLYVTVSQNGILYTHTTKLDREQTPVLTFQVVATDTGNPPLSAFVNVLLRVLDVNDNSPIWLFPKPFDETSVINVSQHATIGFQLTQLRAIDPDEGPNGEISYSILHGNEDGFFEVDAIGGAVYLIKSLYRFNYNETEKRTVATFRNKSEHNLSLRQHKWSPPHRESIYIHKLIIKASDRGSPSLSNTTILYIAIQPAQTLNAIGDESGKQSGQVQLHHIPLDRQRFDHDLVIMIVLIALTSLISLVLIMAICLVRCRHLHTTLPTANVRTDLHSINETDRRKQSQLRRLWSAPLRLLTRTHPTADRDQKEVCTKLDCSELHGVKHISPSPSKAGISVTYTTGSPNNETDTLEKDTYFTIRPCTWKPNIVDDNSERYHTLTPVVGPGGSTFMVEVNPDLIDSTYSVLRTKQSSGQDLMKPEYQSLCLHQICQLHNSGTKSTSPCELETNGTNSSMRVVDAENVYNRMNELADTSMPKKRSCHCETCRQPVLQTFTSKSRPCSTERVTCDHNQCIKDEQSA